MKLIENHAQGIRNLLEWIFGAGEKWLLTLHEIGESLDDAKQLVKDHIQLEGRSKALNLNFLSLSYFVFKFQMIMKYQK